MDGPSPFSSPLQENSNDDDDDDYHLNSSYDSPAMTTHRKSSNFGQLQNTDRDDGFSALRQKLNILSTRANTARTENAKTTQIAAECTRDFSNYREPTNFLTFSRVDRGMNLQVKPRIDTQTMRRVLDNVHDLSGSTIEMQMHHGKVPGVLRWKSQNLYGQKEPQSLLIATGTSPELGPGVYRSETYYTSPHSGGISYGTRKFLDQKEVKQKLNFKLMMKERHSCLNKTSFFKNDTSPTTFEYDPIDDLAHMSAASMASSPTVKFLKGDRWRHEIYRQESYLKTTGFTLGSEYDKAFVENSKVPMTMRCRDNSRWKEVQWPHDYSSDVEVEVNMAHTNLATAVRLNPLKLSASFKSKAQSGFNIPQPTSGWKIGPGAYPGSAQVTQALSIKGPGSGDLSVVFRSNAPRILPVKQALPENIDLALSDCLDKNKGFVFSKTGASGKKNGFLAEYCAKKISKIYPTFKGGIYSGGKQKKTNRYISGTSLEGISS